MWPLRRAHLRWLIAGLALAVLAALLAWQLYRGRLMRDCDLQGGQWDGASSTCRSPGPIIIRPDLQRT